jgi:hypothetical protein
MKITRRQLKRIILEFWDKDVEQFLIDNAAEYRRDPSLDAGSIRMLLMDDFMDHIGHSEDPAEYEDLIDRLAAGEIREEVEKAAPFGSGMEQAELDPDQKEIVGHT